MIKAEPWKIAHLSSFPFSTFLAFDNPSALASIGSLGRDSFESFGIWFGKQCIKAGIRKTAHGVRKLSPTLAAEAGATTHERMAGYGWKTVSQAETYTKGADRIKLGIKTSKLVAKQIKNEKP